MVKIHKQSKEFAGRMRNFIFGVEDSLVSTVGLLSGITVAGLTRTDILLTGVVLIFVEAFSMAVGTFISERSTDEYVIGESASFGYCITNSFVMFFSYFLSGFIPLSPYLLSNINYALWFSISLSLVFLFILGLVSAKMFHTSLIKGGIRIMIIGGAAIAVGVLVGGWVK